MPDKNAERFLDEMPLTVERMGFGPDELTVCESCSRANAPNRPTCLYCGKKIAAAAGKPVRISARKLDPWENGFNVVVQAAETNSINDLVAEMTALTGTESGLLRSILSSGSPLPIARVETMAEASTILQVFEQHSFPAAVVPDDALLHDKDPVRLRGMEIVGGKIILTTFNTGEIIVLSQEEVALIFEGALLTSDTEKAEKRGRGSTTTLDETQTSADRRVLDVYSRSELVGWRVSPNGFDFSFLAGEKSLIAEENIRRAGSRIKQFAPAAALVDDYIRIRRLLGHFWETEDVRDSLGLQRKGFTRRVIGTVVRSSNLRQLNKYSRLRRHLL